MADKAKIRFALDSSLGKLAKWLRILGFDSIYVPGIPKEDSLFNTGEDRIVLTRTHRIQPKKPGRHILFIRSNDPCEQLIQVILDLKLDFSDIKPFSRCIRCNQSVDKIPREEIRSLIPDYVYETRFSFKQCQSCGRIYWQGTHVENIMGTICEIICKKRK